MPARSGILGAVGVTGRVPTDGLLGVTTRPELLERFGPATLSRADEPRPLLALLAPYTRPLLALTTARRSAALI
ncbi:MAG TPA: hypothetical protein VHU40_15840 [Polyangia bacterium]|jgi:hypothetical protein|nr:hypothetical protein [Polyangia bacterium]